jgi:hypothetical protein
MPILLVALLLSCTACTNSVSLVHNAGAETDLIDETCSNEHAIVCNPE